jgi:hypothetical protein
LLLCAPIAEDFNAAIAIHSDPQTKRFNRCPFSPERMRELLKNWLADAGYATCNRTTRGAAAIRGVDLV